MRETFGSECISIRGPREHTPGGDLTRAISIVTGVRSSIVVTLSRKALRSAVATQRIDERRKIFPLAT
jgi:hypothetical protein